jgi:hypothetical protein
MSGRIGLLPDPGQHTITSRTALRSNSFPEYWNWVSRELNAGGQSVFDGAADLLELLAALPSPEES